MSLRDAAEERDEDRHLAREHRAAYRDHLPEAHAANRIAEIVEVHLTPRWWTHEALFEVSKKLVAHRRAVVGVFSELDAGPTIDRPKTLLRQQQVAELDDPDFWAEQVCHLRRELADAEAVLARVRGHRDDFDPDVRDADRADDRVREARADTRGETGIAS